MKTTLLLAVSSLALLTSSCLTMYPIDPMTNEPSKAMMPPRTECTHKKSSCTKSSKCSCSKNCAKVCAGESCK